MNMTLSEKQADLLRYLYRQTGPVLVDHLDGRVVRALKSREFIEVRGTWASITPLGRSQVENPVRQKRVRQPRLPELASRHARAEAIHRAAEALELAIPKDAEVAVGSIFAYADDVVQGFRSYARRLASKKQRTSGA
jgi:hypothetical protein